MKVTTDVTKCISTESMRLSLQNAYLQPNGELHATNGHILAIVPGASEEGDTPGWITPEALKAARKARVSLKANGALEIPGGPTFPRPDPEERRFPDTEKVCPKDYLKAAVRFNFGYLAAAHAAVAESKHDQVLSLFPTATERPDEAAWYIGHENADGTIDRTRPHVLLMPARK